MSNLKSNMNESKTVTMTAGEIDFLTDLRATMQNQLDQLMERIAGMYLNHLATTKFGMSGSDFHFEFHPDREYDNLTISKKR